MLKRANVNMIGAGVVGLATGKGLTRMGHSVTFIDTDILVVEGLRNDGYRAFLPAGSCQSHDQRKQTQATQDPRRANLPERPGVRRFAVTPHRASSIALFASRSCVSRLSFSRLS